MGKVIEYYITDKTTERNVYTFSKRDYEEYKQSLNIDRDNGIVDYTSSKYFTVNGVVCELVKIWRR